MKKTNQEILNAVRSDASQEYQSIIPKAMSASGVEILTALDQYPTQKNLFINSLINKIALTFIIEKGWENPLKVFNKGMLPLGATIETIFVGDAKRKAFGSHFDGSTTDEGDIFGKVLPSINIAYNTVNFLNKYKISISQEQLSTAFVSQNGLSNLIDYLINSIYEQAEVDDYGYTKYCLYDMIGKSATTGAPNIDNSFVLNGIETTPFEPKELLTKARAMSGRLNFKSSKYNLAGVTTFSKRQKLVLLVTPEINAELDVQALATLFNIDKGELNYRVVEVDELPTFTTTYTPPMADALASQETGLPVVQEAYTIDAKLQNVQIDAVVVDEDAFQKYDKLIATRSVENINNLSMNIVLHRQGIAGSNPFCNFVAFGHKTV